MRILAPSLLAVPGCGVLSAAVILGETAGAQRFRSKDAHARFTGTAPIPVWSGATWARSVSTAAATAGSTAPCT
ncbi:transposase [Nocardia sp. CA-107356]|uniref:transposase n=1 Tax=Nocardia sp. CA-107356 TaxID=3239972 RepID=UPI003D8D589D